MECIFYNGQYIYVIKDGDYALFYNNQNGEIARSKSIELIDNRFFKMATDITINLEEVGYEQLYLAVSESCNFRCKY